MQDGFFAKYHLAELNEYRGVSIMDVDYDDDHMRCLKISGPGALQTLYKVEGIGRLKRILILHVSWHKCQTSNHRLCGK